MACGTGKTKGTILLEVTKGTKVSIWGWLSLHASFPGATRLSSTGISKCPTPYWQSLATRSNLTTHLLETHRSQTAPLPQFPLPPRVSFSLFSPQTLALGEIGEECPDRKKRRHPKPGRAASHRLPSHSHDLSELCFELPPESQGPHRKQSYR